MLVTPGSVVSKWLNDSVTPNPDQTIVAKLLRGIRRETRLSRKKVRNVYAGPATYTSATAE